MKYLYIFLFLFPVIAFSQPKTFYINKCEGSDSNSGLSPQLAWKNATMITDEDVNDGDTVKLNRGDVWGNTRIYFARSHRTIMAYGEGPKPCISGRGIYPFLMDSTVWTFQDDHWVATLPPHPTLPEAPSRLFLDSAEVLRSDTIYGLGTFDHPQGDFNRWYINDRLLHIWTDTNPAIKYEIIEFSQNYVVFDIENGKHNTLKDICIEGGAGPSIRLSNSDHNVIENCTVGAFGRSGMLLQSGSDSNMIINNTFDSKFEFYYGLGSERGCSDGVRLANNASYNLICGNTFKNWAHNGVELFQNTVNNFGTNHNTVHHNIISAPDIPYAHPIGIDGGLGRCTANDIAYNIIDSCRTACQINGNGNRFHHNILRTFRTSPSKNTFSAHAIIIAVYDTDTVGNVSQDNLFDHNLIMNIDQSAFRIDDLGEINYLQNIQIRNNIIVNSGIAPLPNTYDTSTVIFMDDGNYDTNVSFENNLIFQDGGHAAQIFNIIDSSYIDVDSLNNKMLGASYYGTDNIEGDPNLGPDGAPNDGSIGINNGKYLGDTIISDIVGNLRIVGGRVDIGPFENQNICQRNSIIFIDSAATGDDDGKNWSNAFTTIYDAVNACPAQSLLEFWIAQGSYLPNGQNDPNIAVELPDSSVIKGGFSGIEINADERDVENNKVILSGNIGDPLSTTDDVMNIISCTDKNQISMDGLYFFDQSENENNQTIKLMESNVSISNCGPFTNGKLSISVDSLSQAVLQSVECTRIINQGTVEMDGEVLVRSN